MFFNLDFWNNMPENSPSQPGSIITDTSGSTDVTDTSGSTVKPEVFNIGNNLYTYDDAQAVCSIYGATVATYDQVEDAYNKGGEWCNYGWSQDQMILFPTQKSTWTNLQQYPKHKNDCGRPGINGGYIANPYMRFGVNCYGIKPPPTQEEKDIMAAKQQVVFAATDEDLELQAKVDYWQQHAAEMLRVNSYNLNEWSEY